MMSARGIDSHCDLRQCGRDRGRGVVDAVRVAPDVEQTADRRAVRLHDPGLDVRGRRHHADPVHVREPAQQRGFVGDAVLQRHDRHIGAGGGTEIERGADRVLRLDPEQHDVVGAEVDLGRRADNRYRERHVLVGALQPQTMGGDRVAVRTACDQHHLVIVLEQARADHATDRARAVHDESHR